MSIIDRFLESQEENRRVRSPETLYVTDLTHPCPQQIYLDITYDRQHDIETLRVFNAGRILEDNWIDILHRDKETSVIATQLMARYYFELEDKKWEIHGRADALCQHGNGALVVHEVKTAKTTHWMREPKSDHVSQLQFYLHILGVENGKIDYLDKTAWLMGDTPIDKSFPIKHNPNDFYRTLQVAGQIASAIQKNEAPPAAPDAWNGRVCDYCLYKDLCEAHKK